MINNLSNSKDLNLNFESCAFIGAMYGEKSTLVGRELNKMFHARMNVVFIRHKTDTRWPGRKAKNHDGAVVFKGLNISASSSAEVNQLVTKGDYRAIGIDELQFYDAGIIKVIRKFIHQGRIVFVAALDTDFMGRPFKITTRLMEIPEMQIHKCRPICVVSGQLATRTIKVKNKQIIFGDSKRIEVGGKDKYVPVCLSIFNRAKKNQLTHEELSIIFSWSKNKF